MAKVIVSKPIGGDGATVTLSTDDSGNLVMGVTYPLAKLMGPIDGAIDKMAASIESALGAPSWMKAIIDPLDAAAKAELATLIGA